MQLEAKKLVKRIEDSGGSNLMDRVVVTSAQQTADLVNASGVEAQVEFCLENGFGVEELEKYVFDE